MITKFLGPLIQLVLKVWDSLTPSDNQRRSKNKKKLDKAFKEAEKGETKKLSKFFDRLLIISLLTLPLQGCGSDPENKIYQYVDKDQKFYFSKKDGIYLTGQEADGYYCVSPKVAKKLLDKLEYCERQLNNEN